MVPVTAAGDSSVTGLLLFAADSTRRARVVCCPSPLSGVPHRLPAVDLLVHQRSVASVHAQPKQGVVLDLPRQVQVVNVQDCRTTARCCL